jgi:small subunit ribosomal protein S6e
MPVFKVVINEPSTRRSYQLDVDQAKAQGIIGKKIGDEFDGSVMGLNGYTLEIRGGTDKDGFPMHPSLKGQGKVKLLLSGKPGFYPRLKGQRKRKMVRGNTVTQEIVQLNVKVVKAGTEPLEKIVPPKPKEKKGEKTEEKK